jgi:hypothetical protein
MSVVSARKLEANRANAQASTGPTTAAGKARSARNAVKHGLSAETWADPAIARAIEQVGRRVAGEARGEERALAYAVAAAQVDLARAREAGRKVCAEPCVAAALACTLVPPGTPAAVVAEVEPEQLEELLCETVYRLEAIKRYEGRAFGRCQRAIQALDAKRVGQEPPPRRPARPRGLRLPRWRLPQPDSRVIRFEGLPRWAWWRPDPLDDEPKQRRAPRRKRETDVPGELELLVSSALLARPRAGPPPSDEEGGERDEISAGAPRPAQLPLLIGESAGSRADVCASGTPPPGLSATGEGEQPADIMSETDMSNAACAGAAGIGQGVIEELRETNPPSASGAAEGPAPTRPDPPALVPPPEPVPAPQPDPTPPWRRGAIPTPLPTCRAGPCRWVGEMPADHWSYRSWRYRRPPARAPSVGLAPGIDPSARRCPGSPRGRSRAPP